MQHKYVNMQDIYLNKRTKLCCMNEFHMNIIMLHVEKN